MIGCLDIFREVERILVTYGLQLGTAARSLGFSVVGVESLRV